MSAREVDRLTVQFVRGEMSRRTFIRRLLALGISLTSISAILAACGQAASSTQPTTPGAGASSPTSTSGPTVSELNMIGWGGLFGDSLKQWVIDPFEAEHNVTVLLQEQAFASESLAKLQAEQANPTVDVWLTTGALPRQLAAGGGARELTPENVPNLADIFPFALQSLNGKVYGAGIHLGALLIAVDNQRIKEFIPDYAPEMLSTWEFLYRPELRDQIGLSGFSGLGGATMVGISKVKGGSEHDEDAFFAAMKELAPNVHVEATGVDYSQLFLSEEIVAACTNPTVAKGLIDAGVSADFGYPTDELVVFLDYAVAIEGGPAGDLAFQFINKILDPAVMTEYDAGLGAYSPNSAAAQPVLPGVPALTTDQLQAGWTIDLDAITAVFDDWNERYQTEIVPLYGG
jgi:putative spermidine/putrescine transport system substrate-binding protein